MQILDLIRQKRSGGRLDAGQIDWMVSGAVAGEIPDYQLAALLMAICYEGLDFAETLALTRAFVQSGKQLSWEGLDGPVVDKHSTGGVGDKVSLLLVPWLAAAGCKVPKMSGRGLGHTGGTIDKLESIPGFRTNLSRDELLAQLESCGCAIVAQSADLVPADRLFYALRDATGTVNEPGLIAASIMSKKIAGGAAHIALDIKCGVGAFFAAQADAQSFGELAVRIGSEFARDVRYVISDMSAPLGRAVGNALEVEEALAIAAKRDASSPVAVDCLALGCLLLESAGISADGAAGRKLLLELLQSGVLEVKQLEWIGAQGGRLDEFAEQLAAEKRKRRVGVSAPQGGIVRGIDALAVGRLAHDLGAGRTSKGDPIDPFAGLEILCRVGDTVSAGDEIVAVYPGRNAKLNSEEMIAALVAAFEISE